MKFYKKLVAVVLSFVMLIPVQTLVGASNRSNIDSVSAELQLLEKIGIINEEDLKKDAGDNMTRAEFAMMMVRLYGMELMAQNLYHANYFYDVDSDYEETGYINAAYTLKLIDETAPGYFSPKQAVTGENAAIAFASLLGYGSVVRGSENNYFAALNVLSQCGVSSRDISGRDEILTREQIYGLVEQSLDATALELSGIVTDGNEKYTYDKNITVLSLYHNIYTDKGIITADSFSSLTSENGKVGRNQVVINGFVYDDPDEICINSLGLNVRCWYQKGADGESRDIIYMDAIHNDILELFPDEIESYKNMEYTYVDDSGNSKTVTCAGADIIYNGIAVDSGINFTPDSGNVVLIDNNDDGYYDIIKINDWTELIFYKHDSVSQVIYGYFGRRINYQGAQTVQCTNLLAGQAVNLDTLEEGMVISACKTPDGEKLTVYVTNTSLQGKVTEFNEEGNLIIQEKEYTLSKTLKALIAEGKRDMISLNAEYIFYLNHLGEVANYEREADVYSDYEYAYVLAGDLGKGIEQRLRLKVKTQYDVDAIYQAADTIIIDRETIKDQETAYSRLCKDGEFGEVTGEIIPQLVRIKLNSNDQLTHIDMASDSPQGEDSLYLMYNAIEQGELRYQSGARGFINPTTYAVLYGLLPQTNVFAVDAASSSKVMGTTSVNYISATQSFSSGSTYRDFLLYGVNSKEIRPSIVLRYARASTSVPYEAQFNLCLGINTVLDRDGEVKKQLKYTENGEEASVIVANEVDLKAIPYIDRDGSIKYYELQKGDIFRFALNVNNEVIAVEIDYSLSLNKLMVEGRATDNEYSRFVMKDSTGLIIHRIASVVRSDGEYMEYSYSDPTDYDIAKGEGAIAYIDTLFDSNGRAMIYNKSANKVRKITKKDILDYETAGNDCAKGVLIVKSVTSRNLFLYEE